MYVKIHVIWKCGNGQFLLKKKKNSDPELKSLNAALSSVVILTWYIIFSLDDGHTCHHTPAPLGSIFLSVTQGK